MTKEDKINLLKGISQGTRNINELISSSFTISDYELMTHAEVYYLLLGPGVERTGSHGPLKSNWKGTREDFHDWIIEDVPKRLSINKIVKEALKSYQFIEVETIHYKDYEVSPVIHMSNTYNNIYLSFFANDYAVDDLNKASAEILIELLETNCELKAIPISNPNFKI